MCLCAFGLFKLSFWLVVLAIISGALGVVRAVIDPDWYWHYRWNEGVDLNYPLIINPAKHLRAMIHLFISKAVVISALVLVAWYIGIQAGYFAPSAFLKSLIDSIQRIIQQRFTWHWWIFVPAFIVCSIISQFFRANPRAGHQRADVLGSAVLGSIVTGAIQAASITAIAGFLF